MANSIIQLPTDGSGKKLDTEELTIGAHDVHRERHQVAGAAEDDLAVVVDAEPAADDHALVVRQAIPPIERLVQENTGAQTDQQLKAVGGGAIFVITAYSIWVHPDCSVDVSVLLELGTAAVADFSAGLRPGSFIHESAPLPGGLARGGDGDDLLLTNDNPQDGAVVVQVSGYLA